MRAPCTHRARTVRPFAYSMSTRSTMPESELPWLVAGLPVYYHRSNGDRVSATVVDPSPLCWSPNYLKWKLKPLELMIMSQNAVADEIEIPVTQPVLSLVLSPVHGL